MRWQGVLLALFLALASAAGAAYCAQRAQALGHEAEWDLTRAGAQADEYARTLVGANIDGQLVSFARRRALLERAHAWQRGQHVAVMGAALCVLAAYGLFLRRRLRDQLVDDGGPAAGGPASALAAR